MFSTSAGISEPLLLEALREYRELLGKDGRLPGAPPGSIGVPDWIYAQMRPEHVNERGELNHEGLRFLGSFLPLR